MHLINLTPHIIRFSNGATVQPSGQVARLREATYLQKTETIGGKPITIKAKRYGTAEGLLPPQPDTLYIVSSLVAHASSRTDLVYPETARNGRKVSCSALIKPQKEKAE